MNLWIVITTALVASGLTLYSGFGLGTLLLPAFALIFPLEIAVAATAWVHLLNNLFKLMLVGRYALKSIVLKFGIPAIPAAFLGAWLMGKLGAIPPLKQGVLWGVEWSLQPLSMIIGSLILCFALWDLLPSQSRPHFPKEALPVGGLLSGFFGGLSGHQGALRSLFLVHATLDPKAYIGTGVVCAVGVDLARLVVYGNHFRSFDWSGADGRAVLIATLAAFLGAFLGSRLLGKVTIDLLHRWVALGLMAVAIAMIFGVI